MIYCYIHTRIKWLTATYTQEWLTATYTHESCDLLLHTHMSHVTHCYIHTWVMWLTATYTQESCDLLLHTHMSHVTYCYIHTWVKWLTASKEALMKSVPSSESPLSSKTLWASPETYWQVVSLYSSISRTTAVPAVCDGLQCTGNW